MTKYSITELLTRLKTRSLADTSYHRAVLPAKLYQTSDELGGSTGALISFQELTRIWLVVVHVIFPASHTVSERHLYKIELENMMGFSSTQRKQEELCSRRCTLATEGSQTSKETPQRRTLLFLVCATESMRQDSIGNSVSRLKQCQRSLLQNPCEEWVNHLYLKYQWVIYDLRGKPNVYQ